MMVPVIGLYTTGQLIYLFFGYTQYSFSLSLLGFVFSFLNYSPRSFFFFFFFNDTATTEIYTLSLHDALPIYRSVRIGAAAHIDVDRQRSRAADLVQHSAGDRGRTGRASNPHHCRLPGGKVQLAVDRLCAETIHARVVERDSRRGAAVAARATRTARHPDPQVPEHGAGLRIGCGEADVN